MLYGSDKVLAPAYVLAYFENKIPDSISAVTLSPEENLLEPEKRDTTIRKQGLAVGYHGIDDWCSWILRD